MSMKEIDKQNATEVNAQYTRHKYIEHVPNILTTRISTREKGIDKYANAQTIMCAECTSNNGVAIEFSRRREHQPSISRTFVRLFVLHYKRTRQSGQQSLRFSQPCVKLHVNKKS